MEKEHFEILLENIHHDVTLIAEAVGDAHQRFDRIDSHFDKVDGRLERLEIGQVVTNKRLEVLEVGQASLEKGQAEIKSDVRDIKRSFGLLHSIANDHEARLQGVENTLRDHLGNHS